MQSAGNLISFYEDLIKKNKILEEDEKKELLEFLFLHHQDKDTLLNNDVQFGYYLAGLIEGDGCFERNRLTICYHEKDTPSAHWLCQRIGFGRVGPIKGKRALSYFFNWI